MYSSTWTSQHSLDVSVSPGAMSSIFSSSSDASGSCSAISRGNTMASTAGTYPLTCSFEIYFMSMCLLQEILSNFGRNSRYCKTYPNLLSAVQWPIGTISLYWMGLLAWILNNNDRHMSTLNPTGTYVRAPDISILCIIVIECKEHDLLMIAATQRRTISIMVSKFQRAHMG